MKKKNGLKMSRNRKLIYRINRKKRRLRYLLNQIEFTDMIYKGHRVTFVDIPAAEMADAIEEAKEMIDEIDKYRKRQLLQMLDMGSDDTIKGRVSTPDEVSDRIEAKVRTEFAKISEMGRKKRNEK